MIDTEAIETTLKEARALVTSYFQLIRIAQKNEADVPAQAVMFSYEMILAYLREIQDHIEGLAAQQHHPPAILTPDRPVPPGAPAALHAVFSGPPPNNYGVKYKEIEAHVIADSALDACARFGPTIRQPGLDGPFTVTDLKTKEVVEIKSIREALQGGGE